MKYCIALALIIINLNTLAQTIEEKEAPKEVLNNYIMGGVHWNWAEHRQDSVFYTEAEYDIGLAFQLIKAIKKNQAIRFTFGLKLGANLFYGETYTQEDTTITPLYIHNLYGLYAGVGKEWQKKIRGQLLLFGGGDITFGTSNVQQNQYAITAKKQVIYDFTKDPKKGKAFYGSIMPIVGIRYNIGRLAMSYSTQLPLQFNYSSWNNVSHLNSFIRPRHALAFGYHFNSNRKKKSKLDLLSK